MTNLSLRRSAQVALDFTLALCSWSLAFIVRFNVDFVAIGEYLRPIPLLVFCVVQVGAFAAVGNYSRLWRYTSLGDLKQLALGVGLGVLIVMTLVVAMPSLFHAPRGVLLSQPVFFGFLVALARVTWRVLREIQARRATPQFGDPIIVVGAGDAAAALLSEFGRSRRWRAVALVDDDRAKRGTVLHGVRVFGGVAEFATISASLHVHKAVIAIPSLSKPRLDDLARRLSAQGAEVFILPPLDSLRPGAQLDDSMRRVRPEELLRRAPVELDRTGMRAVVEGEVVMVTGAGGSIGSELCRQLAELQPKLLILYELNEFAMYQVSEELRDAWHQLALVTAIGDVKDEVRVSEVMARFRPSLVFHAAAYKHVPMMEQLNTFEAVRNNVWGSLVVTRCAAACQVQRLVIVSTDKAVNPTNVMGATKRLAELLVQEATTGRQMRVSIVRFGNVLGSAGSVIPKFVEQIQRGGPITVTHPDITRYFMSIPEAAQLVILSCSVGRGSEIFVLDMGEPVRIVDLARDLIRLMGKSEREVEIVFTGLRPGEKLFEELLFVQEETVPTANSRIRVARVRPVTAGMTADFVQWLREKQTRSDLEVRELLRRMVPEYVPDSRFDGIRQLAA